MPKRIKRLICNVRVEHKTKGQLQFVPQQAERPLLVFQTPTPLEHDAPPSAMPHMEEEQEPDAREVDPYKVAERVVQIMLAETRSNRLRGGR